MRAPSPAPSGRSHAPNHMAVNGWEADERPDPCSLGLLPSGPDPVGEWLVHRQPPGSYIGCPGGQSKASKWPGAATRSPHDCGEICYQFPMNHDPRSDGWALDPLLQRDTSPVGDLPLCRVLLINDANYPWILLVPRRRDTVE